MKDGVSLVAKTYRNWELLVKCILAYSKLHIFVEGMLPRLIFK
jgi:hypothetical protein